MGELDNASDAAMVRSSISHAKIWLLITDKRWCPGSDANPKSAMPVQSAGGSVHTSKTGQNGMVSYLPMERLQPPQLARCRVRYRNTRAKLRVCMSRCHLAQVRVVFVAGTPA